MSDRHVNLNTPTKQNNPYCNSEKSGEGIEGNCLHMCNHDEFQLLRSQHYAFNVFRNEVLQWNCKY